MIVIGSDNEDEEGEALVGFMTSYHDNEMDSFKESHEFNACDPKETFM